MFWNDSSHYKGEWKRGLRSGFGEHVLSNGKKRVGQFIDDKFAGAIMKESEVQTIEVKQKPKIAEVKPTQPPTVFVPANNKKGSKGYDKDQDKIEAKRKYLMEQSIKMQERNQIQLNQPARYLTDARLQQSNYRQANDYLNLR